MGLKTLKTTTLLLAVLALAPAAASASPNQLALFQDDDTLIDRGDGPREALLDELSGLGVDAIKIQLNWAQVAPAGKRRPAGFDATDPSQYSWGKYDAVVSAAQSRGMRMLVTLAGPAPGWATTGTKRDSLGVNRPSAREYGRFAEAAGKHFTNVDTWSFWNEPNHHGFLYPQATRSRVPAAPHIYRSLVRAGVAGLGRAGHASDTILFGELLPIGKARHFRKNNMKPLEFLREFFCVDSSWRPFRGRAAKLRGCNRYKKLTGVSGFAYHPYTRSGGPRIKEGSSDDATIGALSRVTKTLDIARRHKRIGGGRLPIWNTEFGFQSDPPDIFAAKLKRIPSFLSESEWMTYRNRRVASYSQYTMSDTPLAGSGDAFSTWQAGLRFANGKAKPGVYESYRLPLFVRLLGPSAVEVWGDARPGGAGATVQVEQRSGRRGAFKPLGGPVTVSNVRGYFLQRYRISHASRRTFRFTSGGHTSRATKAAVR
jgi:hypothetical protein